MLLAAVLNTRARLQHAKCAFRNEAAYRGMADAFAGVVMLLLVAAGVFARGAEQSLAFIQKSDPIATSFTRQHYSTCWS